MSASAGLKLVEQRLAGFPADAVRQAVKTIGDPALRRLRKDTGGDRKLSGLKNAKPLTIKTKVVGTTIAEGVVLAGPKRLLGPWSWLEDGTKAGNRRGRYGSVYRHPGTRAKRTWSDPVDDAARQVMADIQNQFRATIR